MIDKRVEKFKELLIFIVNQYDNNDLSETKLWKLMYFCEADYFEKNRVTITGVNYYKNHFGPTPDKIVINEALERAKGYINIIVITNEDRKKKKMYSPLAEPNYNHLTANEIKEARESCEKYFRLSSTDIVILAHKDAPFLGSDISSKIDFSLVDYRDNNEDDLEDNRYPGKVSDRSIEKLLSYV